MMTKRIGLILWLLCIVGAWAILPYVYYTGIIPSSTSYITLFLSSTLQSAILYGIICWISFLVVNQVDLFPFRISSVYNDIVKPGIIWGTLTGLILFTADRLVFGSSIFANASPPFWTGIVASIYGGINEEVTMRLFLLTSIYFGLTKLFKGNLRYRSYFIWIAILMTSLAFGAAHLSFAAKMAPLSTYEVIRVLSLNGIAGIIFGWLYYRKGFWAAALAHFIADLVIHAIFV